MSALLVIQKQYSRLHQDISISNIVLYADAEHQYLRRCSLVIPATISSGFTCALFSTLAVDLKIMTEPI